MKPFAKECGAVFVVLTTFFVFVVAIDSSNDKRNSINLPERFVNQKSDFWIKNQNERKKLNFDYEDFYGVPLLSREQLEALLETVKKSHGTFGNMGVDKTPTFLSYFLEDKRGAPNFTPRLGRDSEEEDTIPENWSTVTEFSKNLLIQRSPPFAPRLGRNVNTYYLDPRLEKRIN